MLAIVTNFGSNLFSNLNPEHLQPENFVHYFK